MIAVSSFRAFKDCTPDIWSNQKRARESWDEAFSHIIYFGEPESRLGGKNVTFIQGVGDFPKIKEMLRLAASLKEWSALINADILLAKGLPVIQGEIAKRGGLCAMSRRFEFDGEDFKEGRLIDQGLDIFLGTPSVWKLAASMIPDQFRISNILWDTWVIGFMATYYYAWFYDFTESRIVFHRRHEDRIRAFDIDKRNGQEQFANVKWPALSRRVRIPAIAEASGTKPHHFQ